MLHAHPIQRSRQLRWVLPAGLLLLAAILITLGVVYWSANQDIGEEFWRAHKTIHHTGELLVRGLTLAVVVLTLVLLGILAWALRLTHRVVRPVHTLHQALDELAGGNLCVRVDLHRQDEFQEVGRSLNRLVDEFCSTLTRVHALADQVDALAGEVAQGEVETSAEKRLHAVARELNETMEFFRVGAGTVIREQGE